MDITTAPQPDSLLPGLAESKLTPPLSHQPVSKQIFLNRNFLLVFWRHNTCSFASTTRLRFSPKSAHSKSYFPIERKQCIFFAFFTSVAFLAIGSPTFSLLVCEFLVGCSILSCGNVASSSLLCICICVFVFVFVFVLPLDPLMWEHCKFLIVCWRLFANVR